MRISSYAPAAIALTIAALLSAGAAVVLAGFLERASLEGVRSALLRGGFEWAEAHADGLQMTLTGTAPTEAQRFRAISAASTVVDSARIIDAMDVADSAEIPPPDFSIEILRNDSGVSLIGLVPEEMDRDAAAARIARAAGGADVADLLETAGHPRPEGWRDAMDLAMEALALLPRSKISISAGKVSVTAIADSPAQKRELEQELRAEVPGNVRLSLDISAPRPVITPFTTRFVIGADGARFDACAADNEAGRNRILSAATEAGLQGPAECTLGLGVPSPAWSEAVATGIAALSRLGGGALTYSDADVSLVAREGTRQALFDRVVGELENELPEPFSLQAVLPEPPSDAPETTPEFTATLSPEGQVQLRGRVTDALGRDAAASVARARFGSANVTMAARVDGTLPAGWPVRVLAGLEALSQLASGAVRVEPTLIEVRGRTGNQNASAEISRLLASRLGEGQDFEIDVTYVEELDPLYGIPTPEECIAKIQTITDARKINFKPGSATLDADAQGTMDAIAEVLKTCGGLRIEIGGHTDSQGREIMNLELSQARADAVLAELMDRRVLVSGITAQGYGETQPIADNGTEEGREANRRIEFRLIKTEEEAAANSEGEGEEETAEPVDGGTELAPGADSGAEENSAAADAPAATEDAGANE